MKILMRIIQRFDPAHEREFMELEKRFAELEIARPDYPKGRRLKPIAAADPCHTLIWEGEFPDLEAARSALDLFGGDASHEALAQQQQQYFREIRIEFYQVLDLV
jgi:hypothetical protein